MIVFGLKWFATQPGYAKGGDHVCRANGRFSGGACTPKACSSHTITFSTRSCTGRTGDKCTFKCQTGYRVAGTLACVGTKLGTKWAGDASCAPISCPLPSKPGNGTVQGSNNETFPSTATFTCKSGFVRLGARTAQCRDSGRSVGTWSLAPPVCAELCNPKTCQHNGKCDDGSKTKKFVCTCPSNPKAWVGGSLHHSVYQQAQSSSLVSSRYSHLIALVAFSNCRSMPI
eukprot:COSAG05_NODE_216_length_13897_cov_30.273011_1_plen_229_part_00